MKSKDYKVIIKKLDVSGASDTRMFAKVSGNNMFQILEEALEKTVGKNIPKEYTFYSSGISTLFENKGYLSSYSGKEKCSYITRNDHIRCGEGFGEVSYKGLQKECIFRKQNGDFIFAGYFGVDIYQPGYVITVGNEYLTKISSGKKGTKVTTGSLDDAMRFENIASLWTYFKKKKECFVAFCEQTGLTIGYASSSALFDRDEEAKRKHMTEEKLRNENTEKTYISFYLSEVNSNTGKDVSRVEIDSYSKVSSANRIKNADLLGMRFGKLRVVDACEDAYKNWICRCDCGSFVKCSSKALLKNLVSDCGCESSFVNEEEVSSPHRDRVRKYIKKSGTGYTASLFLNHGEIYIGTYPDYASAVNAQAEMYKLVLPAYSKAKTMWNEKDPEYTDLNPFYFRITFGGGICVDSNFLKESLPLSEFIYSSCLPHKAK